MFYPETKHQTAVLLSSGQETECDGKSESRVDGLSVPCVIFLNSGLHPLQDLSEHGWVYPDKIPECHHILGLQLPHQTIIATKVQPPREPGLHPIPPGHCSMPFLSVNQYLGHHNLIL